jgi:hypothetical protein
MPLPLLKDEGRELHRLTAGPMVPYGNTPH